MSTLAWILVSGVLMSALALVGSVALLLPRRIYRQVVLPLVALAAGSLLGGALCHMLPGALDVLEDSLTVYLWLALGFVAFLVLEQFSTGTTATGRSRPTAPSGTSSCPGRR